MRRRAAHAILVGGLVLAAGCGPIEYIATVPLDAAGALAQAKHLSGDKYAPYEMTAAGEYLHKSRELAGYARFQSAVAFGGKAAENAKKAQKLAIEKAALPAEPVESPTVNGGTPDATSAVTGPVHVIVVTPSEPSGPSSVTTIHTNESAPAPAGTPTK